MTEGHGSGWKAAVAVLVLLVLVLGVAAAVWFTLFRSAPIRPGRTVEVEIPEGSSTRAVAVRLVNDGIVGNVNMFRLRARLDGADGRFKPGTYEFETGSDYEAVIMQLEEGPNATIRDVTIPEGFTIAQIAKRLQAQAGIPSAEFIRVATTQAASFRQKHSFLEADSAPTLEGYLFPKTYRIKKGASVTDIIDMMLDQFAKETAAIDYGHAASRGLDAHQVLTIASMIERETRLQRERPLVSSVIYNRLRKNMYLQIDATVQYVVGDKPRLLYKDLKVDSPYNTYARKGLPPAPIANPGIESLEAAAAPATTPYLYYVLTGKNGSHTFTATAAEFERARKLAKEGLR